MSHPVTKYDVFTLRKNPNGDPYFVSVGTAWANRDGTLSVFLDVLPMDGTLTLRPHAPRPSVPKVAP
jgi:hypothetical protein